MQKIDFTKLLGFDTLSAETATDFTDATVAAKLGAKVAQKFSAHVKGYPIIGAVILSLPLISILALFGYGETLPTRKGSRPSQS